MHCHLHAHTIILLMTFPLWIPFKNEWWTFFGFMMFIGSWIIISELTLKRGYLSPDHNRRLIHFIVGIMITISPMIFNSNLPPSVLASIFIIINCTTAVTPKEIIITIIIDVNKYRGSKRTKIFAI